MSEGEESAQVVWVCYEGIHYAGLTIPAGDAPMEVPAGHQAVMFLDGETWSAVDAAAVSAYDPNDTEKCSHPEAVKGVAIANGLLFGKAAANGSGSGGLADTDMFAFSADPGDDADLDDVMNLLDELPREDKKREKKEKKERERQAKAERKREKKEAKECEKREREERRKEKRRRERDSDDDDDDNDMRVLGAAVKTEKAAKKVRKASDSDSEDDDESSDSDNDSLADESPRDPAAKAKAKAKKEADHWSSYADQYGFGDDDYDGTTAGGAAAAEVAGRRRGGAGGSRGGGGPAPYFTGGASVDPYRPQIRHAYQEVRHAASLAGKVISAYEEDAIRAVAHRLRLLQSELAMLQRAMEVEGATRAEKDRLSQRADDLRSGLAAEVPEIVRGCAVARDLPAFARPRGQHRGQQEEQRRRPVRTTSVFQDPATALTLRDAASQAELRDMTTDVAHKYREQLAQKQTFLEERRAAVVAAATANGNNSAGHHNTNLNMSSNGGYGGMDTYGDDGFLMDGTASGRPSASAALLLSSAPTYLEQWSQHQQQQQQLMAHHHDASQAGGGELGSGGGGGVPTLSSSLGGPSQGRSQEVRRTVSDYGLRYMTSASGAPAAASFLASGGGSGSGGFGGGGSGASPLGPRQTVSDDALNLYNSSTAAMRQGRATGMIPVFYNFDALLSGGGGSGSAVSTTAGGGGDVSQDGDGSLAAMLQAAPLRLGFEGRSAFAIDPEEDLRLGGASSVRSSLASASYNLPSQDSSMWYSEPNSSVAPSADGRSTSQAGGGIRRGGGVADGGSDWRQRAKRAIQERLMLYFRGLRGRPAIITADQFRAIGRTLLDRAVRAEARNQGVSMALRSNASAAPFTKEVEVAIRHSVDRYVTRYFIENSGVSGVGGGGVDGETASEHRRGGTGGNNEESDEEGDRDRRAAQNGGDGGAPAYETHAEDVLEYQS